MDGISADQETKLLDALAAAGGDEEAEVAEHLNSAQAEALFKRMQEREAQQLHKFIHRYNYRPRDGAVALHNVLMRLFGTVGIGQTSYGFFGAEEPEMEDVEIGIGQTVQVPMGGEVSFPMFGQGAYFRNHARRHYEYGMIYEFRFTAPKKYAAHIRGLQKEVEKELATNSIYRGKALDGGDQFIDLSVVDPAKVIYSEQVSAALRADLWSIVEETDMMRELGIPLKHAVLLPGDYGTGKTLIGVVTGQKATANGWTFIQCRPGRDEYRSVMQMAKLYQPCVTFFEDIDTFAATGEDDPLAQLLDTYDGATAKGAEIVAVFTTNHPERIHKAMIRPGRIDAVIPVGHQDADSIQRMINVHLPADQLDDLDYGRITTEMGGFSPAFIVEAIHRAGRHAIVREGGKPEKFVTDDFMLAAQSMRQHLDLMHAAEEGESEPDQIGGVIESIVTDVLQAAKLGPDDDGNLRITFGNTD